MSISLSKGQKVSLTKEGGGGLSRVAVGLGWAQKKGFLGMKSDVDLDASCILFDESKRAMDAVFFGQLRSKDGSIRHTGDDRQGGGRETDPNEVINVELDKVPAEIQTIVFVVNSYSGETFKGIPWAFCNVMDLTASSQEVARFNLNTDGGAHRGFIIAKVRRSGGQWEFEAVGEACSGRQQTIDDIAPDAARFA